MSARRIAVAVGLLALVVGVGIWWLRSRGAAGGGADEDRARGGAAARPPDSIAIESAPPGATLATPPGAVRASNGRRDPSPTTHSVDLPPFLGRVIDESGAGIANARVRFGTAEALEFGHDELRTDAAGRFQVELPAVGSRIEALVSATGLAATGTSHLDRGVARDITLVSGAAVRVLVVDRTSSAPVPDALVRVLSGDDVMDSWACITSAYPTAISRTDARGRAELLAPRGKVQVVVTSSTHAPGTSAEFEIGREGADVRVALAKGTRIAGRVLDGASHPIAGAQVTVHVASVLTVSTLTGVDGAYELGPFEKGTPVFEEMPAIYVDAVADGFARVRALPESMVEGEIARVDLRLSPSRSLVGRLEGPDGGPVGGVKLVASIPTTPLRTMPDAVWVESVDVPIDVDAAGAFVVQGIGPNELDHMELRLRALDEREEPLGELYVPIPATGDLPPIVFRLPTAKLMSVEARVIDADGSPVSGATVRLFDVAGFQTSRPSSVSDSKGIARLYVPDARVIAVEALIEGVSIARAVARKDSAGAVRAEIRLAGEVVEGVVRRFDGSPVAMTVMLQAQRALGPDTRLLVRSDAGGRFRFTHVPPGIASVDAQRESSDEWSTSEQVRPESHRSVTLWVGSDSELAMFRPLFRLVDDATDQPIGARFCVANLRRLEPEPGIEHDFGLTVADDGVTLSKVPLAAGTYRLAFRVEGRTPVVLDRVEFPRVGDPPTVRFGRGAIVRGRFLDSAGVPFQKGRVTIGGSTDRSLVDGEYEIEGVGAGAVDVVFRSDEAGEVHVPAMAPRGGVVIVDGRAPRGGFIEIGVTRLPFLSLEARVEDLGSGRSVEAVQRENEFTWVASGLSAGRYRVTCRIDGLELAPKEVVVVAGQATGVAFRSDGEGD